MINTSHSQPRPDPDLIEFLRQRLGLSQRALELGIRQSQLEQAPLPIVLNTFGLITLTQYQQVLDWQDENQ